MKYPVKSVCIHTVLLFVIAVSAGANDARLNTERTVDFTYELRVTDVPGDAKSIKVWIPLPRTTERQIVHSSRPDYPANHSIVTDDKYQNEFAFLELTNETVDDPIRVVHRITRKLHRALESPPSPDVSRGTEPYALQPSRLIVWNGPVGEEAKRIAGGAADPLDIARLLYDNIVNTVRYDKSGVGWGRGDAQYACDARTGNCTDFHSLFIAQARSLNVPARFLMGFSLPPESSGEIAGYHCWAEFHTPDRGWIPLDASDASKDASRRKLLFGGLDANRIHFTTGRDITLPGMNGEPLNYIIYPYVEVDGHKYTSVETTFSWTDRK